jgi:predicted TIM-barrel fold metal-dependent hydrolase
MTKMKIYDCHIHIPGSGGEVFHETGKRLRTMEELVSVLDACGIDRGVIFSTVSTLAKSADEFKRGNREVLQAVQDYPGRFWGACTVNPNEPAKALDELSLCRESYSFAWLGELCPYLGEYEALSRETLMVVERATELGYVTHMHCNNEEAETLVNTFPDTDFVFAHLQSFSDCRRRYEIVASREGLYVDISGSEIVRHGILELAVEVAGVERLLFGSDLIIDNPLPTISRINGLDLTDRDKEKIFWENMDALLKKHLP